jgi:hypothetical protein
VRHAKRLRAATVVSSVSLLTTVGLADAINAFEGPSGQTKSYSEDDVARAVAGSGGPTGLLVIKKHAAPGGGAVYIEASSSATAPAIASAPSVPTTRSS